MVEKRTPIPVENCVCKVMEYTQNGVKETVGIEDAHGRYLAEDLIADHDVPSFDRSPYDGFAIRAEDTETATTDYPLSLKVVGEIGAGSVFHEEVKKFEAVRLMTGAQIPEGCNAVVMLELTREFTDHDQRFIEIKRFYKKGDNISFQGEDTQKGTVLVKKGAYINPGVVALLATYGYKKVPVAKKPVVGVLATGSELLEVEEPLEPGKIRNSNAYMILAQIERAGGEVKYFGKLSDDLEKCFTAVKQALSEVDLLLTTGGVSVGDYDYLPAIYDRLGASVLFNKVAMRPGSVTTVAQLKDKLIFGLSGNPSACYVGFELFVRPVIRTYLFNDQPHLKKESAWLGEDFSKPNPFTRFVRGSIFFEQGKLMAFSSGFDNSSAVSSLSAANAFIILPGGTRGYQKGMVVDVLLLEDVQGSEWPWGNIVPSHRS
ncbi:MULTISPECIES: gephyrin-like molybdotransferase Glp [unclassified Bacillus (in: firmicutes)]|uniref:molybdopterin molybdotransferase MoeA n=1 Tax=unclassified Bacillus (in: firmicutes) TaxID=185979 RepID=UPI001BE5D6E1|nr:MULTISPECIES: gephyrin-like molybdotransferase Glp [unclassified Bacillus (in: firmicutes)]MBT2613911.1 molybdopterin molybdotransferase MoeA [Bacillus sp. ISL-78]MBT2627790.1 molybdopterin molybdotransferase MoeA [Bacillus sp. ISL-101]